MTTSTTTADNTVRYDELKMYDRVTLDGEAWTVYQVSRCKSDRKRVAVLFGQPGVRSSCAPMPEVVLTFPRADRVAVA